MSAKFLTLEEVSVAAEGGGRILDHINLEILYGEQWAVTGPSGSGKTALAHVLTGRLSCTGRVIFHVEGRIAFVEQQHRFKNLSGTSDLYYQQRFNAYDATQTITVEQELRAHGLRMGDMGRWMENLHIGHLMAKPLIQLSNGENKRVQLAIALAGDPGMLILDNPFLGLDAEGRETLHGLINLLAAKNIQFLLVCGIRDLPRCITHIARLEKGRLIRMGRRDQILLEKTQLEFPQPDPLLLEKLKTGTGGQNEPGDGDFLVAVKLIDTSVRYGDTTILESINWEVRKGEKWSLSGPNGAGKSTLLSLITADNPQAYANEIWLFDRRRGTGESIWDIKKRIGFVSPELHLYFDPGATCFEVVASGLFDTIGLFRIPDPGQQEAARLWMRLLSLDGIADRRLSQLSTGQQRMALLARALIKNPSLLVLDEPCQGLDEEQSAYFTDLIGKLCEAFEKTLIYVTHVTGEIPFCVDRFLKLEHGLVVGNTNR